MICLACVTWLLPWPVMPAILIPAAFLIDRSLFGFVDYFLLLPFVSFSCL